MIDEREDDKIPQGVEDIPQSPSKKIYRLLSILIILSMIVVFVIPSLMNTVGFLQILREEDLQPQEVKELLEHIEENYLYQELFQEEIYHQKKEALLNTFSIVSYRWFVQDQSVEDLQNYLSVYNGIRLKSFDDYMEAVDAIIRELNI
ncbi:MAG: hypothetical protein JJT76_00230 [Clostridiaceae bacterium]|nr:hypothetical protein [Clostridiaceae bacterium]